MSREEIQKLLGGYATDTLGEAERRALFEAALDDQELFDALAKEQALRDVLNDPAAREQLLDALRPAQAPARIRTWRWLQRPAFLAVAGGMAILLVAVGLALRRTSTPQSRELVVAQVPTPSLPSASPAPSASPKASAAPAKPFETLQALQEEKLQTALQQKKPQPTLPAPPVVSGQPQMDAFPRAVVPTPPLPEETVARLAAPSALPEEVARQLYVQLDTEATTIARGALPHARAKIARAGAAPSASNLGVRYSLLLRTADGEYAPARLDTEFHTGDSIRLRLVPNDRGYAYLFQLDSAGSWHFASRQAVERGQPCLLPTTGTLQYDQPGPKELLVVLSGREEPSLGSLPTVELNALAASVGTDILKATVPSGDSAYAVDTRRQAGQQKIAFKITLQVR